MNKSFFNVGLKTSQKKIILYESQGDVYIKDHDFIVKFHNHETYSVTGARLYLCISKCKNAMVLHVGFKHL